MSNQGNGGYTVIDNAAFFDRGLSLKALGLLCKALSLPADWEFTVQGLAAICKDGRAAVESALRELEEAGYLRRGQARSRDGDGRFGGASYEFSAVPGAFPSDGGESETGDADAESPSAGRARTETGTQENTILENKKKEKKQKKARSRGSGRGWRDKPLPRWENPGWSYTVGLPEGVDIL